MSLTRRGLIRFFGGLAGAGATASAVETSDSPASAHRGRFVVGDTVTVAGLGSACSEYHVP